ncbi:neuroglian-like [Sitodiplosis mosellana]|uniref:neuroglian-like n=1 Tax=Sitodiplosis mosellana TaxID=263140 RepID=UPI0024451BFD|nr:neuroglian-like [Sitodiplosis mosellana]
MCKILFKILFGLFYLAYQLWALDFKGEGTTPTNLVISWEPMSHPNPDLHYRVYWKRDFLTHDWNIEDISNLKQNHIVIENQPTFVRYLIKVVTVNQLGESNSTFKAVYSGQGLPIEAPSNLTSTETTSKSTILHWNPVSRKTINGHFKEYEIQIWNNIESDIRKLYVENFYTSELLITDLRSDAVNFVRILASNRKFQGSASETIEIKTPSHQGTVQTFDAFPLGSSALLLRWTQPIVVDKLKGYKISYEEIYGYSYIQSKPEWTLDIDNPQTNEAKLIDLRPDTKYRVRIAVNRGDSEVEKYVIERRTNSNGSIKPDPSTFAWKLLDSNNDNTTIKVIWMPNVDGRPGLNFIVNYRIKGSSVWSSTNLITTDTSVVIPELPLNQVYEFIVVSVDGEYKTESQIREISTHIEASFLTITNVILIAAAIILILSIFVGIFWRVRK